MYHERFANLFYWHLADGTQVDFIINDMEIAIEVKTVQNVSAKHLKGLRPLKEEHPKVQRGLIVCCEDQPRTTEDGIEIVPA